MQKQIRMVAQATLSTEQDSTPKLSSVAYNGGVLQLAGWDLPVIIDLDGLELGVSHPVYRQHDEARILGAATTTREGNSLLTAGELYNDTPDVAEVVRLGKKGFPFQASIGVTPTKVEKLPKGKSETINGQAVSGPMYITRKGKLHEVSIVNHGADSTTSSTIAASAKGQSMEFEQFVSDSGFAMSDLGAKQLDVLRAAFDKAPPVTPPATVSAVIEAAKNKEARQLAYGRIIASAIDKGMDSETANTLVQAATRDNLGETEFELQVLRLNRHIGGTHVPTSSESPQIIEAALARQLGLPDEYKPEVLEASERRFKHGLGLVEVLQMQARKNGHHNISSKDVRGLLEAAFAPQRAAGASTYDLGGVLSNIANKSVRAGYMAVESEWRKIAAVRTVNDLKPYKSYALTGDFTFKKVGNGGELKHATMSEEVYTNQAETFGSMMAITRTDILNDDLGVFGQVRNLLGRGAALAMNKEIWTEFLSNLSMWHVDNKNVISGALSKLDIDSLSSAVQKFHEQVDPDGQPMGLTPAVLLVSPPNKVQAGKLVRDTEMRVEGSTAKNTYTTGNPHAGMFTVAASAYLNNSKIPGGDAFSWWLLANPEEYPTIEVAFLNGQQTPTIEQAAANFSTLSIELRAYLDFGVELQGHRGSVRSLGQ